MRQTLPCRWANDRNGATSAPAPSATIPANQLNPLLNLALRVAGDYNSVTIRRLQRRIGQAEIKLTGDEIRMVLALALKAKVAEQTSSGPFESRAIE